MEFDMPDKLTDVYAGVIAEHRGWLQQFSGEQLKKREDLLGSCSEAAICEAETRKFLSEQNVDVCPFEDLSTGGPDFSCSNDGKTFYVETTCISKDKLTEKSGMPSNNLKPGHYPFLLTKVLLDEIRNKTSQCGKLNFPCFLAIGTLHFNAGITYFGKLAAQALLTGTPQVPLKWDIETGCAGGEPCQGTDLRDSAFIRFTKNADGTVETARNPISAVLLCAFHQYSTEVYGSIHPNPNYPFDRKFLPKIEFCRLAEGYQNGEMKVE